ncbi:hypothetical protein PENARI_c023G02861 [Penicillium arizonense]|uniref:(S)-ureidoglycine aminohydrolase cupin domain-containing protein n=1 Tax=Penicillium arizonense TaxID=1835702 RepID=A0A1F5L7J3_PENAI|nr:hypothetical protein PENARI_c023G02861 [Penicillium arizonense]OGE49194.1 hypothetical protein PENARI_c023G02861 [Penicillium arizonense]
MPFQIKDSTERFKIPNYRGIPNVYFADLLGTEDTDVSNPIVGAWFRMEKGEEATPPTYEYDEFGVVIEGEINLRDETGETATVRAGHVFFFPRGSTITFSSDSYGLAVNP